MNSSLQHFWQEMHNFSFSESALGFMDIIITDRSSHEFLPSPVFQFGYNKASG